MSQFSRNSKYGGGGGVRSYHTSCKGRTRCPAVKTRTMTKAWCLPLLCSLITRLMKLEPWLSLPWPPRTHRCNQSANKRRTQRRRHLNSHTQTISSITSIFGFHTISSSSVCPCICMYAHLQVLRLLYSLLSLLHTLDTLSTLSNSTPPLELRNISHSN